MDDDEDPLLASVRERARRQTPRRIEDVEQAAAWAASADEGTAAYGRHLLMELNLPLLLKDAERYEGRAPKADLVRSGLAGLEAATHKFDVTKGFQFSMFATWWIRQAITTDLRR